MQIRQLQVARDSIQDRLTLRIGTQSREEIRVFITRRFLRELWPGLAGLLPAPAARPTGGAEPANATFSEPFAEDNPTYPLGSTPLLASEATLDPAGDSGCKLTLREGRERSVNLNLNSDLLQALCSMLRAASEQAGWDLSLDYGKPASAPPAATPAKTLLH
jgi:hypothetical protein